jgi:hypothetical protein
MNGFTGTQQFIEWVPSHLANGEFLFSGEVSVLNAKGVELSGGGYHDWFDAWRNPERHALNLGRSERVLVKRVTMEPRINEKASERIQQYRAEITNHSSVAVKVRLIEKVSDANRMPKITAVFERVFAGSVDPISESELLVTRDDARAGWTRDATQSAATFSRYVDMYADVTERVALPYDRDVLFTVPAGSATNLNQPGKIVVFYEISSIHER